MKISVFFNPIPLLRHQIYKYAVVALFFGTLCGSEIFLEAQSVASQEISSSSAKQETQPEEQITGSSFFRFVDQGNSSGMLQTAIAHYENNKGIQVSLIGVVHIGDLEYYKQLQEIFSSYDALLYEMVKPAGDATIPGKQTTSSVSSMQRGMKKLLELEFQLDAVDYSQDNFVHADMDAETFFRVQDERGESLLSLMFQSMMYQWSQQMKGEGPRTNGFQLLAALLNPDRARALKYLLAQEMEAIESMVAGLDGSDGGKGSVILTERNKVAFEVLEEQIQDGKKKLGIFYGAAHLPDMERRLIDMGFCLKTTEWLTAWNIQK